MSRKAPARYGSGLRTRPRRRSLVIGTLAGLVVWELLALLAGALTAQGDHVVPHLKVIVTEGITGLSHFYRGGWGPATTLQGAPDSVGLAALAVLQNGLVTLGRFVTGYLAALALGLPAGLLVGAARPVRLAAGGVAGLLRMLPLLAMAPLFTLWFGATSGASIGFVTFGAFWVVLLATANAVGNLPPHVTDYPRTLGLSRTRISTHIVLPAIVPELRGALVLAAGTAWACVLASELYGIQSGLGWALNQTLVYSLVDQMVLVAGLFAGLSLATSRLVDAVTVG